MTQKQELEILFQELNGFDGFNYDVYSLNYFMGEWVIRNLNADYEIQDESLKFATWKRFIKEDIKSAQAQ